MADIANLRAWRWCCALLLLLVGGTLAVPWLTRAQPANRVFVIDVQGVIGVASARQIARAIEKTRGGRLRSFGDHVLIRRGPRVKWIEFSEATAEFRYTLRYQRHG